MRKVDVTRVFGSPEGSFEDHGLSSHNIVQLIIDEKFFTWRKGLELNFAHGGYRQGYNDFLTAIDGSVLGFDIHWRIVVLDLNDGGIEFEPVADTFS